MKEIILKHSVKYPLMEVRDYLKLFYQNSFGPKHFSDNPSLDNIIKYIETELTDYKISNTNIIENIGNDFVRVSLDIIKKQAIEIEKLAKAFQASMNKGLIDLQKSHDLFNKQVKILVDLIKSKEIKLDKKSAIKFIEDYLDKGIKPLSHSEIYRKNYHPHYRVIHKKYLKHIGVN
ncbi:MAG: hypothetical protein ACOCUD_02400 [Bacillota bacterium]